MIKLTENNKPQKTKDIQYPCLMQSTSGLIILATKDVGDGNLIGTCLCNHSEYDMGFYYENWNRDVFKPIDYSITLKNDF